jgi:hypothetical protein
MAGSYNHVVDQETGKLLGGEAINGALDCLSGDVTECVTEMYGMIWYLARIVAAQTYSADVPKEIVARAIVDEARVNYQQGLDFSPGIMEEL